ncbi:MAG TPA: SAM-dependent methyltransferase [Armatimonadota bacterium]|nr:SAM-dependent methyltransferase [Armatimonadota bacterium]
MKRSRSNRPQDCPYVGKGGLKLRFALDHFGREVRGLVAADLGCHVGGFTDCLLQGGAARVHAVDTGYGVLEWKLRNDPRVVVHERTNVLHWDCPEPLELVVSDLGWTRQARALPAIARLLNPGGWALSLVKPQYELGIGAHSTPLPSRERIKERVIGHADLPSPGPDQSAPPSPSKGEGLRGVLPAELVPEALAAARAACPAELTIIGEARSPYTGSGGNIEVWLLVARMRTVRSHSEHPTPQGGVISRRNGS